MDYNPYDMGFPREPNVYDQPNQPRRPKKNRGGRKRLFRGFMEIGMSYDDAKKMATERTTVQKNLPAKSNTTQPVNAIRKKKKNKNKDNRKKTVETINEPMHFVDSYERQNINDDWREPMHAMNSWTSDNQNSGNYCEDVILQNQYPPFNEMNFDYPGSALNDCDTIMQQNRNFNDNDIANHNQSRNRSSRNVEPTKVFILPREYPTVLLNEEDLVSLEDAISQELCQLPNSTWGKIQFNGFKIQPSMLVLECASNETVGWLKYSIPILQYWRGVSLSACLENEIPENRCVSIYFPKNSRTMSTQLLLDMIDKQNEGLNINMWKILHSRTESDGRLLQIDIDNESRNALQRNGCFIYYMLGTIPVHGLSRIKKY